MHNILGLNLWSHDTSACIVKENHLLCAVEEERFNGEKHTGKFPENAISAVLNQANLSIADISTIAIGWDLKRKIRYMYLAPALKSDLEYKALPAYFDRLKSYSETEDFIRNKYNYRGEIKFYEHHLSHSCYAQFSCQLKNAISIVIDGYGEKETFTIFEINESKHTKIFTIDFPNSIGLFYTSITEFLGFIPNCDEGIVMGLSAYGNANAKIKNRDETYLQCMQRLVADFNELFKVDNTYFPWGNYRQGYFSQKFIDIFGSPRNPAEEVTQHHKNIAAAVQLRIEEILINCVRFSLKKSSHKDVLLSGGVGLNCVANAKLVKEFQPFGVNIHLPQNPGDSSASVGAAIHHLRSMGEIPMERSIILLGPIYSSSEIKAAVSSSGLKYDEPPNIIKSLADSLRKNKICSVYNSGSEFGPRALGFRSILTLPYPKEMKNILNQKVKFRENFRPFAPIVREEDLSEYFDIINSSPYMMHVAKVNSEKKELIPAVVHVDGTARIQTVTRKDSKFIYDLLTELGNSTGIPIVLNTSFNIKGQPIVETPKQAIDTLKSTKIDCLAMPPYFLEK